MYHFRYDTRTERVMVVRVGHTIDRKLLSTINKILFDKLSVRSFCYHNVLLINTRSLSIFIDKPIPLSIACPRSDLNLVNEHFDIEIKDYVMLSRGEDNRIPPLTLMMDVTMTRPMWTYHSTYTRNTHTQSVLRRISSDGPFNMWSE
jgi:hypothetical protein